MRDPLHAMTESVNSTLTDHHGLFPAFVHGKEYLSLWTIDDRGSSLQSHPHESLACVSEQVKCSFDQKCMCYANFLTLNSLIFTKIWVPWNPPGHKRVSREENRRLVFLRERWPQQKHPLVLFCAFSWSRWHCWGGINKFMYFFNFGEMLDESRGTLFRLPWLKANRFL